MITIETNKTRIKKWLGIILVSFLLTQVAFIVNSYAESYIIGKSDVINLSIYAGGEQQHDVDLEVSEKGLISVPLVLRAQYFEWE